MLHPWLAGTEEEFKEKFKGLYELGPVMGQSAATPYDKINEPSRMACLKGGRKPTFSVALEMLDAGRVRRVFDDWVKFGAEHADARGSVVISEVYNYEKVKEVEEGTTAFPHREIGFHMSLVANYMDEGLDGVVKEWGDGFRSVLHGGERKQVYVFSLD